MKPKWDCIYRQCKMVNLCKGNHCVGAGLDADGFKIDGFGNIVAKTQVDFDSTTLTPTDGGKP